MSRRILTVYGTRPEAIKVAPVIIRSDAAVTFVPVVTGQHRTMLDQVNGVFGISPIADLDVLHQGSTLNGLAARMLSRLGPLLQTEKPDAVLVQGDTTTALAGALAAFYERIPVIHLEAGLRTDHLDTPFPEEGNRRLISQVSRLHLAPTDAARANLLRTGIAPSDVVVTGNTVIDALHTVLERVPEFTAPVLRERLDPDRDVILVTSHRRESWGEPMQRIAAAMATLATARPDLDIVLPLHANPAVRDVFTEALRHLPNVILTDALDYADFCLLLRRCILTITDSGGVQEEAPALGKPVLVLRDDTERPEAIAAGAAVLVGTDERRIVETTLALLDDPTAYATMATARNPFGDGHAAERVRAAIAEYFGEGRRLPDFAASTAPTSGGPL